MNLDNLKMDKLTAIIQAKLLSWLTYSMAGASSVFSFMQFENRQWGYGIIGAFGFIVAIIAASYVKLKLGQKELDVTETNNEVTASVTLAKMFQEMAREEKEFWTKRLDEVAKRLRAECEEEKKLWADREERARNEKHEIANKCNAMGLKYDNVITQLKVRGVHVDVIGELIWPERLQKLRKDDPRLSSGEISMKEEK
jgi:hypothetical protein